MYFCSIASLSSVIAIGGHYSIEIFIFAEKAKCTMIVSGYAYLFLFPICVSLIKLDFQAFSS